jgi:hypothetical protein
MIRGSLHFLGALILVALTGQALAQSPPARLHFIDVQDGHALLIDAGEYEILFDGGSLGDHLSAYLRNNKIIDGDLDLLIVSDGHTYSYRSAERLFFPSGSAPAALVKVAEVWTPGDIAKWKNSTCESSNAFRAFLERAARVRVRSPVQTSIQPIVDGGSTEGTVLSRDPLIKVFLLNAGIPDLPQSSERDPGECARLINQGAIVLGLEIHGVRILLAGDVET